MTTTAITGATTGAFDMFHIGHLNLLARARQHCDRLIVGVADDESILASKGRLPVVPLEERIEIVRHISYVDDVFVHTLDWEGMVTEHDFSVFLKGDDWRSSATKTAIMQLFEANGVRVQYFPYTSVTSSTHLRKALDRILAD
ncbi:MAG: adenylyltransferase/cytidyltransferase family protein [Micropruina sp.]